MGLLAVAAVGCRGNRADGEGGAPVGKTGKSKWQQLQKQYFKQPAACLLGGILREEGMQREALCCHPNAYPAARVGYSQLF